MSHFSRRTAESSAVKLRRDLASGQLEKAGENAAKVKLTLEDGTPYAQDGKLEFSEVSVDQTTGSVTLRAVFPNPADRLVRIRAVIHIVACAIDGVHRARILFNRPERRDIRMNIGENQ